MGHFVKIIKEIVTVILIWFSVLLVADGKVDAFSMIVLWILGLMCYSLMVHGDG